MYEIEVADNQDDRLLSEDRVREIVRTTLTAEQVAAATISIAIVDNPTMHELNRQYLNHDYETDVLSFLLDESQPAVIGADDAKQAAGNTTPPTESTDAAAPRGSGRSLDGEVIVSAAYARQMAAEYDWPAEYELTLYLVHGVLHLCGYDDTTASELPVMRGRERDVFELLQLPPPVRSTDDTGHVVAALPTDTEAAT